MPDNVPAKTTTPVMNIEDLRKKFNIPDNMTAEDIMKGFSSYRKAQDYTKKRDKANRDAHNELAKKYPAEFKVFLNVELRKQGMTPVA